MTEREYNLPELLDELRSLPKDQAFFLLTAALRAEQVKEHPRLTDADRLANKLADIVDSELTYDSLLHALLVEIYRYKEGDNYAAPQEQSRLTDAEIDMYPRSVLREIVRGSVSVDEGLENILAHYRDHYAAPQPLPSDEEAGNFLRNLGYSLEGDAAELLHWLRTKAQWGEW